MANWAELWVRHKRLRERATSPKSVDCGHVAIFSFRKYCRHCGKGLEEPTAYCPHEYRRLYSRSWCSDRCKSLGPRTGHYIRHVHGQHYRPFHSTIEEAAFLAARAKRVALSHPEEVAVFADQCFHFRSEKLRFLEIELGRRIHPSLFYRLLRRVTKKVFS